MSLPRRDVRFYLDADTHEALRVIAETKLLEIAELVEKIIVHVVSDHIHEAKEIAKRTADLVISSGVSRKGPEL